MFIKSMKNVVVCTCITSINTMINIVVSTYTMSINTRVQHGDILFKSGTTWNKSLICPSKHAHSSSILLSAHSGHRVFLCPAPSVYPSVRPPFHPLIDPALITILQPTIFHGSYSYLAQPLTLVWARTLLIMSFLCSFCRIQWHIEILWIH